MKENQSTDGLKELALKIETLAGNVGKLKKDGFNQFSKYAFVSADAMMEALRGSLIEVGLSIIPSVLNYEERDFIGEKTTIRTIVTMNFRIVDLTTGYFIDLEFTGAEQDNGGKSMQQAITQATKYFLFKLLKTTTDGAADSDANTTHAGTPAGKPAGNAGEVKDDKPWLNEGKGKWDEVVRWVAKGHDINKVRDSYAVSKATFEKLKQAAGQISANQ